MNLNAEYWNSRYDEGSDRWDVGEITTPLKNYFDQLTNKNLKILIPGGGRSYEAEYLWKNGFKNVSLLEYAAQPIEDFKKRIPDFPLSNLLQEDFFKHQTQYDLIVEQTFFCAIDPQLRNNYAAQMHQLLHPNGKLVGLLFLETTVETGPPFGGTLPEYKKCFEKYFEIKVMEQCYNSIPQRAGRELFIILVKK